MYSQETENQVINLHFPEIPCQPNNFLFWGLRCKRIRNLL